MSSLSPFDQFEIKNLIPYTINDIDLSFTNSSLSILFVVIIILYLSVWMRRNHSAYPNTLQIILESIKNLVRSIIIDTIGTKGLFLLPMLLSLFLFILIGNLIGLVPGVFTFTSHLIVTFLMATFIVFSTMIIGIYKQRTGFFKLFVPSNISIPILFLITPIEVFSFFTRSISLSMRLFANMMAGHVVLDILFHFIGNASNFSGYIGALVCILGSIIFFAYEVFVALMQAYIFTMLSCACLKDGLESH